MKYCDLFYTIYCKFDFGIHVLDVVLGTKSLNVKQMHNIYMNKFQIKKSNAGFH